MPSGKPLLQRHTAQKYRGSPLREIVLQLKAPSTWASELTAKYASTVRILDCKPGKKEGQLLQLVEVNSAPEELDKLAEDVKNSPAVKEAYVVKTKKGRMLGSILTESVLCSTLQGSSSFCRSCLFHAVPKSDGTVEWTVAFTGREALNELLDVLKREKVDVKILRLTSIVDAETLTDRQRKLVETALEEGFFDYPRRITLRQLAKKTGASASTVSEVLRRAQKKILSTYGRSSEELSEEDLILGRKVVDS